MHAGRVSEALLDFTGGVHMHFELKSAPADLWEMMYRANQAHALMGCETAGVSTDFIWDSRSICEITAGQVKQYIVH